MPNRHPFGTNHQWRVTTDMSFKPLDLDRARLKLLVGMFLLRQPELMDLNRHYGGPVIVAATLGRSTIDLRIYCMADALASRGPMSSRLDHDAALYFDTSDLPRRVRIVEGELLARAQTQVPVCYASRHLTPDESAWLVSTSATLLANPLSIKGDIYPVADKPLQTLEDTSAFLPA